MSILKLKDSQGNWIGVPTIKGDKGNGISSAVLNNDYTLTLTFTDGTTYTTPSIRGEKGEQGEPATDMDIHICSSNEYDSETRIPTITNPDDKTFYLVPTEDGTSSDLFTEWVYVNNAWEMFGSASVDLTDYVKNTDIASSTKAGVVKINSEYGIITSPNGELFINTALETDAKNGSNIAKPVTSYSQHASTFYGLAKVAGHDEKDSELPVGQYTDEAKSSIQNMLDVPSNADLDEVEEKVEQNTEDLLKAFPIETASGNIASFEDGANDIPLQSLVVDIDPIQDLHGYDSPYPAGGGKNKLPYPYYSQDGTLSGVTFSTAQDGKITASGTTTEGVNFFLARDISLAAGTYTLSIDGTHTALTLLARNPDAGITLASIAPSQATATFTLAETANVRLYFNTSMVGASVSISAYVQLELGTTATSYAPYSNICLISGWTQVDVEQSGKNVLSSEIVHGTWTADGRFYSHEGSSSKYLTTKTKISVVGGLTYLLSYSNDANNIVAGINCLLWKGNNPLKQLYVNISTGKISIPNDADHITLNFILTASITTISSVSTGSFQLELGSTATPYEPYTGRSITIDLGQTVYGGKLDVLSGVLTVDRAMVDLGTLNWVYNTTYAFFTTPSLIDRKIGVTNMVSDLFKTVAGSWSGTPKTNAIWGNGSNATVYVQYPLTAVEDFLALVTGHQLVYELATPIEIQLSANQINSLYGVNNLWADSGDTTAEYRADPDLYIQRKMPEVPVDDVQINGTSIVTDGVANIPVVTPSGSVTLGLVRPQVGLGTAVASNGGLAVVKANASQVKAGTNEYAPIVPQFQHQSTFYGLAKIAGVDEKNSTLTVGNYTDNAKDKIQTMLGVSPLIAPHESDPFESAHVIGELFIVNGKLYRAKTALAAGEYINEGTNVEVVDVAEVLDGKVGDVQINGTSVVTDGVANIPRATTGVLGVVRPHINSFAFDNDGRLVISAAGSSHMKEGTNSWRPIMPNGEHIATFYGLAKASGDTTQSQSNNAVGTYTDEAKASIKSMLGVQDGMVVNATLVSGTQYTIDSTYDDIKTALSVGKTVVVMSQGIPQPYVGNVQIDSAWYLAFGISTTFNKRAVLTGFVISEAYQNIAIWMEEFADIPDVQIDGTSIVTNSVANIPIASANKVGVVKINAEKGIVINGNQELLINYSSDILVKNGTENYKPLVPSKQHVSTFYGLAKAAGADMSASSNAVGTYTEEAKTAIKTMLGVHDTYDSFIEEVTGTDVTITGQPSYRYNCGEVYSLTVTPPSSGTIDIRFISGSTPTVLTLPQTVKMPEWWVEVEANTIYEMCITDGIYCGVMTWAI